MNSVYDYLIITHLPSFYKVNLYREMARHLNIYVVFIAGRSAIRTDDFICRDISFEHEILFAGSIEERLKGSTLAGTLSSLRRIKSRKVLVGGWDLPEFWAAVLFNERRLNALTLESTSVESPATGFKGLVKRLFVSRIGTAFPSGTPHQELLNSLGYRGATYVTGGVGIFPRPSYKQRTKEFSESFLYVGRLSPEKNLLLLAQVFNKLPHLKLTIVGSGPMEPELRRMARDNITFKPHVPNQKIPDVYLAHDVLILPSLREPWGFVVDEALYYGLPVIASRHVGCHRELIRDGITGLIFDPFEEAALVEALQRISKAEVFHSLKRNVELMDFNRRDEEQVKAYIEGCEREQRT